MTFQRDIAGEIAFVNHVVVSERDACDQWDYSATDQQVTFKRGITGDTRLGSN
jgi:hypothetical protein